MVFKKIFKIFFLVGALAVQHTLFSMTDPVPEPGASPAVPSGAGVAESKKAFPVAGTVSDVPKRFMMRPVPSHGQALEMALAIDRTLFTWQKLVASDVKITEHMTVADIPSVYRTEEPFLYYGRVRVTVNDIMQACILFCENRWEKSWTIDYIMMLPTQEDWVLELLKTVHKRALEKHIEVITVPKFLTTIFSKSLLTSVLTKQMKSELASLGFGPGKEALVYKAKK